MKTEHDRQKVTIEHLWEIGVALSKSAIFINVWRHLVVEKAMASCPDRRKRQNHGNCSKYAKSYYYRPIGNHIRTFKICNFRVAMVSIKAQTSDDVTSGL